MIRRFRLENGHPARDVKVAAVKTGASGRYSAEELADWLGDPAMPEGWGAWLHGHISFVDEAAGKITGFMMLERSGYLNMAFALLEQIGRGVADALYAPILAETQALALPRLLVLASRYAQSFFARHGWRVDRMSTVTRDGIIFTEAHMVLDLTP